MSTLRVWVRRMNASVFLQLHRYSCVEVGP
jgi:hypothetical protein